jgi:hypothetical protein
MLLIAARWVGSVQVEFSRSHGSISIVDSLEPGSHPRFRCCWTAWSEQFVPAAITLIFIEFISLLKACEKYSSYIASNLKVRGPQLLQGASTSPGQICHWDQICCRASNIPSTSCKNGLTARDPDVTVSTPRAFFRLFFLTHSQASLVRMGGDRGCQ